LKLLRELKLKGQQVYLVKMLLQALIYVTKDSLDNDASLRLQAGSYGQFSAAVTAGVSLNESNHIFFQKHI
jgi:iron complex outermembrane receptor protein